ncbi:FmdE family protein [Pelotalea chapellei]|uniref:Formylmethanofuran dehydrogenase n=1 Tax=Pelotalea chapellei TaxID=44671 RepID=A0ABS5U4U1_9BACT|nr:FmdE family protein [Pelotalea chapellei]MBT1070682.1 formylmethanofuran dehydrogenase [Pelotalea chapellei]
MSSQGLVSIITIFAAWCLCFPCHALAADDCPDQDVYQRAEQFHGHTCTGLIIGIRIGIAAKEALRAAGVSGSLKAQYYSKSCPVDGLQIAIGTTYSSKSIEVIDHQENRLILSDITGRHRVEAKLTEFADQQRLLSISLKKKIDKLQDDVEGKDRLEQGMDDINSWFRTAPDAEVVELRFL